MTAGRRRAGRGFRGLTWVGLSLVQLDPPVGGYAAQPEGGPPYAFAAFRAGRRNAHTCLTAKPPSESIPAAYLPATVPAPARAQSRNVRPDRRTSEILRLSRQLSGKMRHRSHGPGLHRYESRGRSTMLKHSAVGLRRTGRRMAVTLLAVGLAGSAAIIGGGSPAYAAGSVMITPPSDHVLYDDCYDYAYSYAVTPPTADWNVDVEITDPFGAHESGDYIYDAEPRSGTSSLNLCGSGIDSPGTYTITATLTWYDASYNKFTEPPTVVSFTLARPATRTTIRASTTSPDYNTKVVFRAKSTVQGRLAYAPHQYEKVRLEAYVDGTWRKIDTTTTDSYGRAKFTYRWNTHKPRVKVRAVTLGSPAWAPSASDRVVIRVQ